MANQPKKSLWEKLEPKSSPFKGQLDLLLAINLEGKPPRPVVQVSNTQCALDNMGASIRNLFLIPWMIGLIITCYANVENHIKGWKGKERSAVRYIASTKRMFGDNFFERTEDPVELRMFRRIKNGVMPYRRYLEYRYNETTAGKKFLVIDITLLILYGLVMPSLMIWIIRWPQLAPLYFDRERQLLYSWRKGKVWAARYGAVRVHKNFQGFYFHMHYFNKKGKFGKRVFAIQPSGNPLYNTNIQPFLAFISQFMAYGKEHVYPGQGDYMARRHFHFFKDKKPDDFEKQLDAVLEYTDRNLV